MEARAKRRISAEIRLRKKLLMKFLFQMIKLSDPGHLKGGR